MDKQKGEAKKLKRGQLYWMILETIGLGLVAGGGSPLRPTLPIMIKHITRLLKEIHKLDVEEEKVKKSLTHMEKKEIIDLVERDDQVFVYLKDKNNATVLQYSIKALLELKNKKKQWDGKWFLVFFDVPEIQRNKRDILRKFLTKTGFYRYQKSIYIFPYECEQEIVLIKKIVEGAKYMKYIIAEKIEDEEQVKAYFQL